MRIALLVLLAPLTISACHSVGGIQPRDTAEPTEGDTDADADGDTDTDTDADGDADGDSDADSDTDTDPVDDPQGDYHGVVWVMVDNEWWPAEGTGEFEIAIDGSGDISGYAFVDIQGHMDVDGDISGRVVDGMVVGAWTVYLGWDGEAYPMDLSGFVEDGTIHLDFEEYTDWMYVYGTMDGER
jgi:hypothetical protein